jgi:peptidyl-prolyl cis-trans isomerase A (cyclophilin A)
VQGAEIMSRNRCSFLFLTFWIAVAGCETPSSSNSDQGGESSESVTPVSNVSSTEPVPDSFRVKFETSKGDFVVQVTPAWAPRGAQRFQELVKSGFYDECRFFRVIEGFMAQFGLNGNPTVQAKWRYKTLKDDSVVQSNIRGYVTYAKTGQPNSRGTQIFINFGDNARLDRDGFAPFGVVTEGMDVVEKLYSGYGEGFPGGRGPNQGQIQAEGNAYLNKDFPKLDYIKKATIIEDSVTENTSADANGKKEN